MTGKIVTGNLAPLAPSGWLRISRDPPRRTPSGSASAQASEPRAPGAPYSSTRAWLRVAAAQALALGFPRGGRALRDPCAEGGPREVSPREAATQGERAPRPRLPRRALSGSGASRQPGVRDAWGLEAPVPVLGGKHTSPELVLTKERTFPLTCGYAGAGSTGAPGPPDYGTQEDAGQEERPKGRREPPDPKLLPPLQAWGVGGRTAAAVSRLKSRKSDPTGERGGREQMRKKACTYFFAGAFPGRRFGCRCIP